MRLELYSSTNEAHSAKSVWYSIRPFNSTHLMCDWFNVVVHGLVQPIKLLQNGTMIFNWIMKLLG